MEKLLLRVNEVAESLGICRTRAYDLINAGTIPSIRLGKSLRVPAAGLRAWLAQEADAAATAPTKAEAQGRGR